MTPAQLVDYIEFKLGITQTTDFADMLLVTNTRKDELCSKMNALNPNIFATYSTENLTANVREYDLGADVISTLKAVFLKLDGTDFVRANWLDFNDPVFAGVLPEDPLDLASKIRNGIVYQEDWITDRFSNSNPYVFTYRQSLFILSGTIATVSGGIQLWHSKFPDDLPNLTESTTDLSTATKSSARVPMGIPRQLHEVLARMIMVDYKNSKDLPLTPKEMTLDQEIDRVLDQFKDQNLDQPVFGAIPYSTGHGL
jgi:hypothetical protein